VSTGDVDSAGHLAVFVPGFRTSVDVQLPDYDARNGAAADLATRLSAQHGNGRPAVAITWFGYQTPQLDEVGDPRRSVLSEAPAAAGAGALAGFLTGLHESARARIGPSAPAPVLAQGLPRIVVWGHSYGSTVTGLALRDHRPPVDAAVVFGSPGLGVRDPGQLHLPAGGLYVVEAPGDPVADAARYGADPGSLPGVTHVATNRIRLPDGSLGTPSLGHEAYLTPGSTSAWSLAAVAAGTPELVRTTGVCHPIDLLRRCG
jgi:pimeloyl-ACP methyl ester carboxylesterase